MQLYTNEFTSELKAEIDRSPFSDEELAAMPEDARTIIAEQEPFIDNIPSPPSGGSPRLAAKPDWAAWFFPSIVKPQCSWTMGVTPA